MKGYLICSVNPHHFQWGKAFLPEHFKGFWPPIDCFWDKHPFSSHQLCQVEGRCHWEQIMATGLEGRLGILLGETVDEHVSWEVRCWCDSPCSPVWMDGFREINWTNLSTNLPDPSWNRLVRWLVVFRNHCLAMGYKKVNCPMGN